MKSRPVKTDTNKNPASSNHLDTKRPASVQEKSRKQSTGPLQTTLQEDPSSDIVDNNKIKESNNSKNKDSIAGPIEYTNQKALRSTQVDCPPKPLRGQQRGIVYEENPITSGDVDSISSKVVSNRSQCRRETLDGQMVLSAPLSSASAASSSCKLDYFVSYLHIYIILAFTINLLKGY